MLDSKRVKSVFFDAGGTLFRPFPSVGEIYAKTALKHGLHATSSDIERLFGQAWHSRNGLSTLAGATSDRIERDWWYGLVKDVFAPLGSFNDFEAFFAELYDLFARPECWRLFEDSVPLLQSLKEAGYRLAMISNWDHRLFSIVKGLGIESFFERILASSVVGVAKPGAAIFHQALEALQVTADQALHIGDSLVDDYQGATAVGMRAVLLDRVGAYRSQPRPSPTSLRDQRPKPYNGVVRIESLSELPALLLHSARLV